MRIRSTGEIMNYFDFYLMQADGLHACVPISALNSFSTKMLVRQVGHVTINLMYFKKRNSALLPDSKFANTLSNKCASSEFQ